MIYSFVLNRVLPFILLVFFISSGFSWKDGDKIQQILKRAENQGVKSGLKVFFKGGSEREVKLEEYSVEALINEANAYLGTPHRMGGTTKKGIDCSGLVRVTHQKFGILLPHSSHEQARYGKLVVSKDNLEKGDLVFFYNSYNSSNFITHAGIYLGDEKFIHASHSQGVIISSVNDSYWGKKFLFGTRFSETAVNETLYYAPLTIDSAAFKVSADHPFIQYTGRIDFKDKKNPAFAYPGVSITAKFEGPSIACELNDYSGNTEKTANYYAVLIDGNLVKTLRTDPGKHFYSIIDHLKDTIHEITLFKRTESSVGKTEFGGFLLDKNKKLVKPSLKPVRKIEFIGDSYTCGYGNDLLIPAPPEGNPNTGFSAANENNYIAWGNLVSRSLGAQYVCTAYSGKGVYRNFGGDTTLTMPDLFDRIFPEQEFPKWDFSNFEPDLAVIHLGTNDFFQELSGVSKLDSGKFVGHYIEFLKNIRSVYPETKIVCVPSNGLNDFYPAGASLYSKSKRYVGAAVDHLNNKEGDKNIYLFSMVPQSPPYGEDWHPSRRTHESMSEQILPFLKKIMGW